MTSPDKPTIAVVVFTDGRHELLEQTLASFRENVTGNIVERWLHDDSGDSLGRATVRELAPEFSLLNDPWSPRRGFASSIRYAWEHLALASHADYIFHLEDDFTFNRPIDLDKMVAVVASDPWSRLAQMALLRQPWNEQEHAAGGIVQMHPDEYLDCAWLSTADGEPVYWLEHERCFTTNPCVYPRRLPTALDEPATLSPWPVGPESEGRYTIRLREAGYRFGYWGRRDDPPAVHHIGDHRAGTGY